MLNENSAKLLEEKLRDKAFLDKVFNAEEATEVVDIIKEEGIDITEEEVISIRNLLVKKAEKGDELSEDELDSVAGGIVITTLIAAIAGAIGFLASGASAVHTTTRGRW